MGVAHTKPLVLNSFISRSLNRSDKDLTETGEVPELRVPFLKFGHDERRVGSLEEVIYGEAMQRDVKPCRATRTVRRAKLLRLCVPIIIFHV
jgi:hypothetical protein